MGNHLNLTKSQKADEAIRREKLDRMRKILITSIAAYCIVPFVLKLVQNKRTRNNIS